MEFPKHSMPHLIPVRQILDSRSIEDVRETTRQKLLAAGLQKQVKSGARIAITAGSRGMGGFLQLLHGISDAIRTAGGLPFIIPAMGSHGGATAQGQEKLLRILGVRPEELNAPIHSGMETDILGKSDSGAEAHLDQIAAKADGIIVLGRVKTHPENTQGIASGLLKMVTIGLGKQTGAQEAHSHGLWESVQAVPKLTLASKKVLFGVAVVENAFRRPVQIEVVPGDYDAFYNTDKRLLKVAKKHFVKLPFTELDLLVVDKLGKNISGTGMDLNVIGTWRLKGGKKKPDFKRIVVLSLTEESMGNGLGIGLADFTTERFMRSYNPHDTYINLFTATEPDSRNTIEGSPPLALSSDREAMEVALYSGLVKEPKVCRIESTARLDQFWVSPALESEVRSNSDLEILGEPELVNFDTHGNLF